MGQGLPPLVVWRGNWPLTHDVKRVRYEHGPFLFLIIKDCYIYCKVGVRLFRSHGYMIRYYFLQYICYCCDELWFLEA